jgi:hypothetical protein
MRSSELLAAMGSSDSLLIFIIVVQFLFFIFKAWQSIAGSKKKRENDPIK